MSKTIVFDLDGTLVDSVRDLLPALNNAIASEGLSPISIDDVGQIVGQGALKMIERAFDLNEAALSVETRSRLLDMFLAHYEANIATNTVFFDGCLDVLDQLSSDGWLLAVCTNKYEHLARKLLDEMGETSRFAAITGGDTFEVKKPDPAHIVGTVERAGGELAKTIMVGDSINDIAAAQAAGVLSIGIEFGYTDIPVTEMGATTTISHFNQFISKLRDNIDYY